MITTILFQGYKGATMGRLAPTETTINGDPRTEDGLEGSSSTATSDEEEDGGQKLQLPRSSSSLHKQRLGQHH